MELYQIDFPSGKKYIGISNNAKRRFWDHKYHAKACKRNYPLYNAMRKYGLESCHMTVLVIGAVDYVRDLEIKLIEAWQTRFPHGYNISFGGDISPASNPEVAKKISESSKRKWLNPEYRANISAKAKAYKHTTAQKEKNSLAKKAAWQNPEYRERLRKAHTGKKASAQTKLKMSESAKGHPNYNNRKMLIDLKGRFVKAVD